MNFKKVGVILSVYDGDLVGYMKKAIDSIYAQTYGNVVLYIGVDGKVNENIMQYLKIIENNPNTKILWYNENRGLACVLNDLLDAAIRDKVDYIARMDADDIALQYRFEKQVKYLDEHTRISVLGGAIQEIDEDDNYMLIREYPCEMDKIKKFIVKANPLSHGTVMFRVNMFDLGIKYNPQLRKNQDLDLWFNVIKNGYIISNLPDILICFRRTKDTYVRRRNMTASRSEFRIFSRGIKSLHGYSWRLVYPVSRFCIRLMPPGLIKFFYDKAIFKKILK